MVKWISLSIAWLRVPMLSRLTGLLLLGSMAVWMWLYFDMQRLYEDQLLRDCVQGAQTVRVNALPLTCAGEPTGERVVCLPRFAPYWVSLTTGRKIIPPSIR